MMVAVPLVVGWLMYVLEKVGNERVGSLEKERSDMMKTIGKGLSVRVI